MKNGQKMRPDAEQLTIDRKPNDDDDDDDDDDDESSSVRQSIQTFSH